MDETTREPMRPWRYIQAHLGRIVFGTVLLVGVFGAMLVVLPYQREQRIARMIESHGGSVGVEYRGPDWIPNSIQNRMPFFDRIDRVILNNQAVPSDVLSELGSLTSLEDLHIFNTQVTDTGLEHLKGLSSLQSLTRKARTPGWSNSRD